MKFLNNSLALYAVTDRAWLNGRTLENCVEDAIKGGVTLVQLREKELEYHDFLELAKKIKKVCHRYNVPFIINDNLEVAIACDADGIHIGQNDEALVSVRKEWATDKIYGVSVQTIEQAKSAEKLGVTYLGVGAMFTTKTKDDAKEVSIEQLTEIVESVNIPVCGIGGINKANISKLYGTGIDGVALVSEIFNQNAITKNAEELSTLVKPFRKDA